MAVLIGIESFFPLLYDVRYKFPGGGSKDKLVWFLKLSHIINKLIIGGKAGRR
jgi:hypothetical protein